MKKNLLMIPIFLGLMLIAIPNLYAYSVNFDTYALQSWGRIYGDGVVDQDNSGAPDPIGVALTGLDPNNPGYSFDNPYDPGGVNNPTQALTPNVYAGPDGTEDSWGIIGLNRITTSVGATVMSPAAGKEWAIFFWGADDVMLTSNHAVLGDTIFSEGTIVEIWETDALDGSTYSGQTVQQGTSGRSNPLDPSFYNYITNEGQNLLTLVGHDRFIDLDGDGIFDPEDDTDGDGFKDVYDQEATAAGVGAPYSPPFTFANNSLFDVTGGLWATLFDTNTRLVTNSMTTGFADFDFSGQFFDNRSFYGGPGNGDNFPTTGDVDDMWTVYDQPSVQGDLRAIPEPGTMLLLGCGLIGLAGFGRKKKMFKKS